MGEEPRKTKQELYEAWVDERVRARCDTMAALATKGEQANKPLNGEDLRTLLMSVRPIDKVGEYLPENEDPNVLIFGPWLERGGTSLVVSTTGTGKSTHCMQLVHCAAAGVRFAGFVPHGKLHSWVFQTEDSPRRFEQDRLDVRAELAEQYEGVISAEEWEEANDRIHFYETTTSGPAFLSDLYQKLSLARCEEIATGKKTLPDFIVLNPFLAFIGGPINDGAYVTPFLRGGLVNREESMGLQRILKEFNIAAIIYHHTAKPPQEKDLKTWINSSFSEYQGAGSSDLTNFVRSVIVMQKVFGHYDWRMITAAKNGGELGWARINDAPRYFIAFSHNKIGVSGKGRHAWRDLDDEEMEIARGLFAEGKPTIAAKPMDEQGHLSEGEEKSTLSQNEIAQLMAHWIHDNYAVSGSDLAMNGRQTPGVFAECNLTQKQIKLGGQAIARDYEKVYHMTKVGNYYGFADSHRRRRDMEEKKRKINEMNNTYNNETT